MISGAGIGLRHAHYAQVANQLPKVNWLEIHAENFFSAGGLPHFYLEKIRKNYPISCHGVGLSLGSADGICTEHLRKLKQLIDRYQPTLVSEHMSWSAVGGVYSNDLLPLPYTEESLACMCAHIQQAQDFLQRQILIENPSSYVRFSESSIAEWDFFAALPQRTGCALLLDVNNVYVSCHNHGYDAERYLAAINPKDVQEIHIAGFSVNVVDGVEIFIDDHGSLVKGAVWQLLADTLKKTGDKPVLVEWDTNVPELELLLEEAHKVEALFTGKQELTP